MDLPHAAAVSAEANGTSAIAEPMTSARPDALVDVRPAGEYAGKILAPPGMSEAALRGGHAPGAQNAPWAKAVAEDGTFRPIADLAKSYEPAVAAADAITYCRIGERSSHTWFVFQHPFGHARVRNYDGSWTEHGNLLGAPVAVGAEPCGQGPQAKAPERCA